MSLRFIFMSHGLTLKGYVVHNVDKASSNDALIVHSLKHVEGIQCKSSDNITRGIPPNPKSKGILELGKEEGKTRATIWAEWKKVTGEEHKIFYSSSKSLKEPKFNLFIISNKPLKNYEEIKKAVEANDYENGLPKGVAVVCHQNFEDYAGPFATQGLYLPIPEGMLF